MIQFITRTVVPIVDVALGRPMYYVGITQKFDPNVIEESSNICHEVKREKKVVYSS